MNALASNRGFSLVGVLIAVVLVSLALVALSGTMVSVVAFRNEAGVRSTAMRLGAAYLEQVKTRDPAALASETRVTVDELGAPDPGGRFARSLIVTDAAEPRSKRVVVTVEYPRGSQGDDGTVTLVSIIYTGAS